MLGVEGGDVRVLGVQEREVFGDAVGRVERRDPPGDGAGDERGAQLPGHRDEGGAVLVGLADDPGTFAVGQVVEQVLQLFLDDAPLLLDDEYLVEAAGEGRHALGLQGPDHADLVDGDAELARGGGVDPQVVQGLAHVETGLARGHDAEPAPGSRQHGPVQGIGAAEGERGRDLAFVEPDLLLEPVVRPAEVQPVGRQLEVVGRDDGGTGRVDVDDGRALGVVRKRLESDPQAGKAGQGEAVQSEVDELPHVRRDQHRHRRADEGVFRLVGRRRRLRRRIVPGDRQQAAVPGRPVPVALLEDVPRTVDAGTLAVPDREDAVIAGVGVEMQLLRPPGGGQREILVDAGNEPDVTFLQVFFGLPEGLVVAAQRANRDSPI